MKTLQSLLIQKKLPLAIPVTMDDIDNTAAFRCTVVKAVNFARAAVNLGISDGVAHVVVVSENLNPSVTSKVRSLIKPLTEQMLVGLKTHDGELTCSIADINASTFKVVIIAMCAIPPAPDDPC